jgi:hypothetical protein
MEESPAVIAPSNRQVAQVVCRTAGNPTRRGFPDCLKSPDEIVCGRYNGLLSLAQGDGASGIAPRKGRPQCDNWDAGRTMERTREPVLLRPGA